MVEKKKKAPTNMDKTSGLSKVARKQFYQQTTIPLVFVGYNQKTPADKPSLVPDSRLFKLKS